MGGGAGVAALGGGGGEPGWKVMGAVVGGIAFPAAVTWYLLTEFRGVLEQLTVAVHQLGVTQAMLVQLLQQGR